MVPVDGFNKPSKNQIDFETLECTAQECPVVMKDGKT